MGYMQLVRQGKIGKRVINKLCRMYRVGVNDQIVLLPETDEKRFSIVNNCIGERKKKDKKKRFILIAEGTDIQQQTELEAGCHADVLVWVGEEEIQCIIKYQMLYRKRNYIIASLKYPEGRHMERLLGIGETTEEKVIRTAIFKLQSAEGSNGQVQA